MKKILSRILIVVTILFPAYSLAQITVSANDFKQVVGYWTGKLTYLDYSSGKPYSMPANLVVVARKNKFILVNIFPNEPKANSADKVKISKNGQKINKQVVKSKLVLSNGQTQIMTEYSGKDNNKKATIRMYYMISEQQFIIRKEVKYIGEDTWLKRNEYKYVKQ